jgi:hypothetical protein
MRAFSFSVDQVGIDAVIWLFERPQSKEFD